VEIVAAPARPLAVEMRKTECADRVDDELLRQLTAHLVEDVGCVPLMAANADQALGLLEKSPEIALMITDIQMPGMDGVTLSYLVRQRRPNVALIIVSGNVIPREQTLTWCYFPAQGFGEKQVSMGPHECDRLSWVKGCVQAASGERMSSPQELNRHVANVRSERS
jgi:CheY-like chemotaxis protein